MKAKDRNTKKSYTSNKTLYNWIVSILALSGLVGSGVASYIISKDYNFNLGNSSIKEGIILRTDATTMNNNEKGIDAKKVIIDSNNNGIEDANDVAIDEELFTNLAPKAGFNVIFLQNEKANFTKILATENSYKDLEVLHKPSEYFIEKIPFVRFKQSEKLKNLDSEFQNIIAQKTR